MIHPSWAVAENEENQSMQVQLAALEYESSRLVRILDDQGRRIGFGEGGMKQVVSAR